MTTVLKLLYLVCRDAGYVILEVGRGEIEFISEMTVGIKAV